MWNNLSEPTEGGWYLIKILGCKVPAFWNDSNKFFAELTGKSYRFSQIEGWLDDSAISQDASPDSIRENAPKYCVCCATKIEELFADSTTNHKSWEGTYNGGIVEKISAGYGSRFDGNMYVLAICDDCIHKKVEEGLLENMGNYLFKS